MKSFVQSTHTVHTHTKHSHTSITFIHADTNTCNKHQVPGGRDIACGFTCHQVERDGDAHRFNTGEEERRRRRRSRTGGARFHCIVVIIIYTTHIHR